MGAVTNQTIRDFYEQATRRGFARDFQFKVVAFKVNGIEVGPRDLVFLKAAALPGKSINTTQAPFMGLNFQIPGTVNYDGNAAWNVKFYCTQDYNLRKLIENSMADTFSEGTSLGNMEPRDLGFNLIRLSLVDDLLREIRTYTLHGAFITKISEEGYDPTGGGKIQEVNATVAYQYWSTAPSSDISYGRRAVEGGNIPGAIADVVGEGITGAILNKTSGTVGLLAAGIIGGLANQATQKAINSISNSTGKLFGGGG